MHLFYTPDLTDKNYCFNETESRHCNKVLRLTEGDFVHLIDGKGGFFKAEIIQSHQKHTIVSIVEELENPDKRDYKIHIAVAPTKNIDRLEWFLEKACEIGVDRITPLLCKHSERKIIKNDRLEKILVSAMKQSFKATLPQLDELTKFSDFIKDDNYENRFIAYCDNSIKERVLLKNAISKGKDILIIIGPEGDFSPQEIEQAFENSFAPVSLGDSRLRTETAALFSCSMVNIINQ